MFLSRLKGQKFGICINTGLFFNSMTTERRWRSINQHLQAEIEHANKEIHLYDQNVLSFCSFFFFFFFLFAVELSPIVWFFFNTKSIDHTKEKIRQDFFSYSRYISRAAFALYFLVRVYLTQENPRHCARCLNFVVCGFLNHLFRLPRRECRISIKPKTVPTH